MLERLRNTFSRASHEKIRTGERPESREQGKRQGLLERVRSLSAATRALAMAALVSACSATGGDGLKPTTAHGLDAFNPKVSDDLDGRSKDIIEIARADIARIIAQRPDSEMSFSDLSRSDLSRSDIPRTSPNDPVRNAENAKSPSDSCKNPQYRVTWSCEAEFQTPVRSFAASPHGDYYRNATIMAEGSSKTGSLEGGVSIPKEITQEGTSGTSFGKLDLATGRMGRSIEEQESYWKQQGMTDQAAAEAVAAARRLSVESSVVRDTATDATEGLSRRVASTSSTPDSLRTAATGKDKPSSLSRQEKRILTALEQGFRAMQAQNIAQRERRGTAGASDFPGSLSGLDTSGVQSSSLLNSNLVRQEFELFDGVQARVGPEYNSRFGIMGRGDISMMIGEDAGFDLELAIGPKQREALIKAGWQFSENGQLRITAHELRQLMEFEFASGNESRWVAQHTIGATIRFKPNIKYIEYLEASGYLSKSDSQKLATKTFTIDTPTLFELWENERRIAGTTNIGASGAVNFRLTDNDTVKITLGAEHKRKDLMAGPSSSIRVTGGAQWEHDFNDWHEGLKTSIGINRDSVGYNAEARITQDVDSNISVSGLARQSFGRESMGTTGGSNDTTLMLQGTWRFNTTSAQSRPPLETARAEDPAGIDRFVGRPADARSAWSEMGDRAADDNDRSSTAANDNISSRRASNDNARRGKMGTLIDFLREGVSYNPRAVEVEKEETTRRRISIDKTGLNGATVDSQGNIDKDVGFALWSLVSAVNTTNGGAAIPLSIFSVSGSVFHVTTAALEPYLRPNSTVTNPDTITIVTTNATITIVAYKGSVRILSITQTSNDVTPPLTTAAPSVSGTTATGTTLSATINENGTGYYLVQAAAAAAPTAAFVKSHGTSFAMAANTPASAAIGGLAVSTAYKIYFVSQDSAPVPNLQTTVQSVDVTTGVTPSAPSVTVDDTANTVAGWNASTMEAAVSTDGGLTYGPYSSTLPDLTGNKRLKVRVKAAGANPASPDTILDFTTNPVIDVTPPPTPSTFSVLGAGALAGYTSTALVALNIADVTDPNGVSYLVSESPIPPDKDDAGWGPKPASYTLSSATNGAKTLYVYTRDNSTNKNVQLVGKSAPVIFDNTIPVGNALWTGAVPAPGMTTNGAKIRIATGPSGLDPVGDLGLFVDGGGSVTVVSVTDIVTGGIITGAEITVNVTIPADGATMGFASDPKSRSGVALDGNLASNMWDSQ